MLRGQIWLNVYKSGPRNITNLSRARLPGTYTRRRVPEDASIYQSDITEKQIT